MLLPMNLNSPVCLEFKLIKMLSPMKSFHILPDVYTHHVKKSLE